MKKETKAAIEAGLNGMEQQTEKKKPGNVIVNIALVVIILLGIFCSFTAFVTKSGNGVPSFFGIRPFAIKTGSMEPTFYSGDLVIDKVIRNYRSLEVGDIITFWTVIQGERTLNTHRIVEIVDCGSYLSFVTKGDNNTLEDYMTVHQSEVVGKYSFHIRKVGSFIDYLQTSKGFMIVIVIPCALFFLYELINFFRALFAYQSEKMRMKYQPVEQNQVNQTFVPGVGGPVKETAGTGPQGVPYVPGNMPQNVQYMPGSVQQPVQYSQNMASQGTYVQGMVEQYAQGNMKTDARAEQNTQQVNSQQMYYSQPENKAKYPASVNMDPANQTVQPAQGQPVYYAAQPAPGQPIYYAAPPVPGQPVYYAQPVNGQPVYYAAQPAPGQPVYYAAQPVDGQTPTAAKDSNQQFVYTNPAASVIPNQEQIPYDASQMQGR